MDANFTRRIVRPAVLALTTAATLVACGGSSDTADAPAREQVVTVYLGRQYGIEPVFSEFTAATGIQVRFTAGGDPELRERLVAEGKNTPADVVITADAANIELAARKGVLAPLASPAVNEAIPEALRSADDRWTALSRRARSVVYSTERVATPPTTYAQLGDPAWKGKLCLRPSTHPYTQSLVAGLIVNLGADRARAVVDSWIANDPVYINSDTDIYKAVAAGECDVALANSYYLGRLKTADPNFPVAIAWAEQAGSGVHINVSAVGITANAPNPTAAKALVEWLATKGQASFAAANFEYPADPDVAANDVVASWGTFTGDLAAIRQLGEKNAAAVDLLSAAGYE